MLADADLNWAAGSGALYLGALDLGGIGGDVVGCIFSRISVKGLNVYFDAPSPTGS